MRTIAPMHPEARRALEIIAELERGLVPPLPISEMRALAKKRSARLAADPPDVGQVVNRQIESPAGAVPVRFYYPPGEQDRALPAYIYAHGGGFAVGDLDMVETICRTICRDAGIVVASVDYRLAPENKFPAGLDDMIAVVRWIARNGASVGIDPARLAVGGDSAGGNLAAVVSIAARDAGDLPIRYQLLIYPATDMRRGAPSHTTNGAGYLLTRDTIAYFHDHYIDEIRHDLDWRASPLLHADLSNLPPALVLTAGHDPLRDEGHQYAVALTQAGNRATYLCFERQIHGFITMGRVLDEANAAVSICAADLRRALTAADSQ